ncbi:MAG: ATP-dependent DNA helicase [Candidatus Thermoplasmatota archaeon]
MSEFKPNEKQQELIENTEGVYIADAGPGTGKTFTISLRYTELLEDDEIEPDDILLITFTNNAAENMKERIINRSDQSKSELRDAPISTFHSFCHRILMQYGNEAPGIIGIDDTLAQSTRIIENEILEKREFESFIGDFMDRHPEYMYFYRILYDKTNLLDLIKSLGAKGIFPKKDGWYRNSEKYLDGDFEKFKEAFEECNEPREGARGPIQSLLKKRLSGYKNKCFLNSAPSMAEIRGEGKKVPERFAKTCFEEDRNELKRFIHDVYFEYIEYALDRNYLNFSLMMMLTFVLICEDHDLREELSFDYIMIDEFQDTNEIEFKLSLLLSRSGNICAVGDWKQSIFSFQYASVDNIIRFEERLKKFKEDLNSDFQRVNFPAEIEDEIKLKKNYRATQELIDFSEQGLLVEATKKEVLDKEDIRERITNLKKAKNEGQSEIGAYVGEDKKEVTLSKITKIVNNPDYMIEEDDEKRKIKYEDITVLTRTRKFGLNLFEEAKKNDVPAAYEGGIELFRRRCALLLLAWLRIVQNRDSKRGWSVVLDDAGYSMVEIKKIFETDTYPDEMEEFRNELMKEDDIGSLAKRVFKKYSIENAFSDKIIEVIQSTYQNTYFNRGEMINFIVDNIESDQTYEVDSTTEDDVFKIQTIHSSKGLEYPVVILADMGPTGGGFGRAIEYTEPLGLRQNKIFSDEDQAFSYDNWKNYVMSKCTGRNYDEERRLIYVAMTRAENYLFITEEEGDESEFFNNLDVEVEQIEPDIRPSKSESVEKTGLHVDIKESHAPVKFKAHSMIDRSVFDGSETGPGPEYGSRVHRFAERYAEGEDINPKNNDETNVKRLIDDLEGKKITEKPCLLPIERERKFFFEGVIDLINVNKDLVKILDYKTDRNKKALDEYKKQLSIYYHVVESQYQEKEVVPYLYYSYTDEMIEIEPLSKEEIYKIAE